MTSGTLQWPPAYHRWLSSTVNLLYPPVCTVCGSAVGSEQTRSPLCVACVQDLVTESVPRCRRCARPLPQGMTAVSLSCPHCHGQRYRFERAFALGVYGGKLREIVLRMKQSGGELLTLAMGRLLADYVANHGEQSFDRLISVPAHWTRRIGHRVNCTELLLEQMADRLHIPAFRRLVYCRRRTQKQGTLLPAERLRNVRRAYSLAWRFDVQGQNLLVIDDVMTTGATSNEIARVLKRAGAASVSIAVVARGVGFDS